MHELFPGTQVRGATCFAWCAMPICYRAGRGRRPAGDRGSPPEAASQGALSLLQVGADMPPRVLNILVENFEVDDDVVVKTADRLGFGD